MMQQNSRLPTGKALSLSHMSSNIDMALEIWNLMDLSGILSDVE